MVATMPPKGSENDPESHRTICAGHDAQRWVHSLIKTARKLSYVHRFTSATTIVPDPSQYCAVPLEPTYW